MRRGSGRAALLVPLAVVLLGAGRPAGLADVRDVRHWSYPEYTRVVVELTAPSTPELHRLGPDPEAGRPARLYVDLPGVWVGRRYDEGIPVRDGLLEAIRLGQNTLHRARLVLDLAAYDRHRLLVLRAPDRVVVDVFAPRPAPAGAVPVLPPALRPVRTVIIDPGHGGRDPGATGLFGLREKRITLSVGRRLRALLEARGFRVVMTRDRDRTLTLEERTAIAEGAGGDLFVSLHVNASPRAAARGLETYYLDPSDGRHTITVAARENGVSRKQVDVLQRTLAGLRVAAVSPQSRALAAAVQGSLLRALRGRYRRVDDLGAKPGPFYVLYLSSMPAVLVEMGFLTNHVEARRLRTAEYRDLVARALADALGAYRTRRARLGRGAGEAG